LVAWYAAAGAEERLAREVSFAYAQHSQVYCPPFTL
jgi:hypothetical protein